MKSTGGRGWFALILGAALVVVSSPVRGEIPAFNGAEGFGAFFAERLTGNAQTEIVKPAAGWFADAEVYHVTTNEDILLNGKGAPGTLRGAFVDFSNISSTKQKVSKRIVVFDVGGTFVLTQGKLDIKEAKTIYVAGQTAPSPVTVYGDMTQITKSDDTFTQNVILRYMTFRKGTASNDDSITFSGGDGPGDMIASNMILDHVTASWAEDENLSVANNNTDITVQYSMIHDALVNDHAYGSLIRPKVSSSVTFHHNLYANNSSRQARFGTYGGETLTADFRNNVIYNFRDRASYSGGSSEPEQEFANVNYIGNYIIAGPGTGTVANKYGGEYAFSVDQNTTTQVFQAGNYADFDEAVGGSPNDGVLDGSLGGQSLFKVSTPITDQSLTFMSSPFAVPSVTTQAAPDAYNQILNYVGNYWWQRDAIDQRVINNVINLTSPPLAASAPPTAELDLIYPGRTSNPPVLPTPTHHPAEFVDDEDNGFYKMGTSNPVDSNIPKAKGDGMPSYWELAHGLDPNVNDAFGDFDNDGYTNLQEYVDELGAFPAPTPITFTGAAGSRYALIQNWKTADYVEDPPPVGDPIAVYPGSNWQPTRFDEARINSGSVVVDAVGQHAGVLRLATNGGNNATLNITAGWLEVATETHIAAAPGSTATINVNGSATSRLNTGSLAVGAEGNGTLNILQGTVNSTMAVIGMATGSDGGVTVSGADARWNVANDVLVGFDGPGSLLVANGGEVAAANVIVGAQGQLGGNGVVNGNVENNGLVLPGTSPGILTVAGNFQQTMDGVLSMELSSAENYDRLIVQGDIQYGGVLELIRDEGFQLAAGATFDLIDWFGTKSGVFNSLSLPMLDEGLAWDMSLLDSDGVLSVTSVGPPVLVGDYNDDGRVDAGDYVRWRNALAGIGTIENETESPGEVDVHDYNAWKGNYGAPFEGGGGLTTNPVPEPTGIALVVLGSIVLLVAPARSRTR